MVLVVVAEKIPPKLSARRVVPIEGLLVGQNNA